MDLRHKSTHSNDSVFVRFINKSTRDVDVVWLDYKGLPVKYFSLGPDHYRDMTTFITHPWIFEDSATKDKLLANSQFVFYPPNWLEIYQRSFPDRPVPEMQPRIVVLITIPVYTLRERCLQVVRDNLNGAGYARLEECLQLPKSVNDDLIMMILKKDGYYIS